MQSFYVTGLAQASGATAVAAGLASLLAVAGRRAGYFKPVSLGSAGPQGTDADASFCKEALSLGEDLQVIAPLTLTGDAIASGLGGSDAPQRAAVARAWKAVSQGKDAVFIEGLPASGATRAASAELAALLDARVLLVVRYRRGMDPKSVAEARDAFAGRLAGVVLNAVPAYSWRVATEDFAPALRQEGIPVLGAIPEDRLLLGFPVADYCTRLQGQVLNCQERTDEIVESLLMGAMVLDSSEHYYQRRANKALITRADRPDLQWNALDANTRCLILTGGSGPIPYVLERATEAEVPVVVVPKPTMETIAEIESFVASPTFHHRRKLARSAELLRQHVDLAPFGL